MFSYCQKIAYHDSGTVFVQEYCSISVQIRQYHNRNTFMLHYIIVVKLLLK